MDMSYTTK